MNTYTKLNTVNFIYQEIEYMAYCAVEYKTSVWTADADGNRPEVRTEVVDVVIELVKNEYNDEAVEPNNEMRQIILEEIYG